MILCGGRGTRLQEHMPAVPKPLVEIGGRPILWHVIQIYLAQGFRRFLLLTGHRGEQIEAFADRRALARGNRAPVPRHRRRHADRRSPAPGRVRAVDSEPVCVTYADGVADIDLDALLSFHAEHGARGDDDGRSARRCSSAWPS